MNYSISPPPVSNGARYGFSAVFTGKSRRFAEAFPLRLFKCRFVCYNASMTNIFEKAFGPGARLFTLDNGVIRAGVTDYGAALTELSAGGVNTVLCYGDAAGYAAGSSSLGAVVGRYAGRIGGARFTLGGREYLLEKNDGANHLHGGFGRRLWHAEKTENGVRFTLASPDGDEGFPGTLRVSALYELAGSALRLTFEAETDADTVLNLTNHSYFNLNGGGDVGGHYLRVNADRYAETAAGLIPTGRLLPTAGTEFDFVWPRELSTALKDERLSAPRGLDHSFSITGADGSMRLAAELYSPETGAALICRTTQPTVHVYTAGFLDMDSAPHLKGGAKQLRNGAVCLETQHFPDSPNRPQFPTTLLRAGERFKEVTEYELAVR